MRHAADPWAVLAKSRGLCRDGEIAVVSQMVTTADRVAVDARDDRLRAARQGLVQQVRLEDGALLSTLAFPVHISSSTERLIARTGQNDDPDSGVATRVLNRERQFLERVACERVVGLGTVDGDACDVVGCSTRMSL